jgi:perosamine synthetase
VSAPIQSRRAMGLTKRTVHIAAPSLSDEEWFALREPITTGWLTQGPKVAEFERRFAERHGVVNALAVTSCTTGLHLALAAIGVGPGDEVIVPAFTWVATANVVVYCGATPVFVDVDPVTYNLDIAQVASRISNRTRAVVPVHLFGLPADIDALRSQVPDHIAIVEDAACAAGASLRGRPVGGLGDVAAFSFHPRKSITTGEGGMVTTNNIELASRMNQLRNHGATVSEEQRHGGPQPYLLPEFNLLGYNYRMTDLQAALGLVQLQKLDTFVDERTRWSSWYREQLAELGWLRLPSSTADVRHGWQAFVTYVEPAQAPLTRNRLMQELQELGVATRPGTHAVHMLAYYRERYGLREGDFPCARDCAENTMAIPLHNRMTADDYQYVVNSLRALA